MSNVRELLARLNPTTVKFDVGRGGIPELTNLDIAGALAFVPAGLGREVLEAAHWPDGAYRRRHKLRDAVMTIVMPEIARQSRRVAEASLDLQLAEAAAAWSGRGMTAEQLGEIQRRRDRLALVKSQCWPRNAIEHLPTIVHAIVGEIAHRHLCSECGGRGHVLVGELVSDCVACGATGRVQHKDARRAAAIGADRSNYAKHWRPMYEHLLREMETAEQQAASALGAALEREAA